MIEPDRLVAEIRYDAREEIAPGRYLDNQNPSALP